MIGIILRLSNSNEMPKKKKSTRCASNQEFVYLCSSFSRYIKRLKCRMDEHNLTRRQIIAFLVPFVKDKVKQPVLLYFHTLRKSLLEFLNKLDAKDALLQIKI